MGIDFSLSLEQRELQRATRELARKVLSTVKTATSHLGTPEERFAATRPFYRELVQAGLLRRQIPSALGGTGTGLVDLAIIAEELWAVDPDVPLSLYSTGLGLLPLLLFGTPQQHEQFLPPFLSESGEPLAAFAFSEVGGSANFDSPDPNGGFHTVALREGEEWVINGDKQFTPHASGWNGDGAELLTVVARTDMTRPTEQSLAVFIVPGSIPGVQVLRSLETPGHRSALVCRVHFDHVRVPISNMIGQPGEGSTIVNTTFSATAGLVGAFSVGVMRQAFDVALNFARTEYRGGTVPIIEHQNVATILVDSKMRIEAARYLTWKACDYFDKTAGRGNELAIASKIFSSETAVQVIYDTMRLVGVESYTTESPLASLLQDALAYPLFDGGNVGVRRRQLQRIFSGSGYDPLAALEGRIPG